MTLSRSLRALGLALAIVAGTSAASADANPRFQEMLPRAETGDHRAEYIVGMMYLLGQDRRRNIMEAARWLDKSAEGNVPQALVALANLYDVGAGVPLDATRSLALRKRAAALGNPEARAQLKEDGTIPGQRNFRRANVLYDLDMQKASIPWAKRAAAEGSANAELFLGRAYHFGLGVATNLPVAVAHYRRSSDRGLADGARHLAYMYEWGLGTSVDLKMAVVYYDRASRLGDPDARQAAKNLRSPAYIAQRFHPRGSSGGGTNGSTTGSGSAAGPSCQGGFSYQGDTGRCGNNYTGEQRDPATNQTIVKPYTEREEGQ